MRTSVCLSVRLLAYSLTTRPSVTKFSAHVADGRGSVLLWRRCGTLCTSGLADDVCTFAQPAILRVYVFLWPERSDLNHTDSIPTKFC